MGYGRFKNSQFVICYSRIEECDLIDLEFQLCCLVCQNYFGLTLIVLS